MWPVRSSIVVRGSFSAFCCRKNNSETLSSLDYSFIDDLEARGNLTPNEGVIVRHLVRVDEHIRLLIEHWGTFSLRSLKDHIQVFRQNEA